MLNNKELTEFFVHSSIHGHRQYKLQLLHSNIIKLMFFTMINLASDECRSIRCLGVNIETDAI